MVKACCGIPMGDSPDIPCMLGAWVAQILNWAAGLPGRWRGMSDRTIPPGIKKTAMMIAVDGIYRTDRAKRDDRADGRNVGIGKCRLG